ncbi:MAG: SUMF1/EgtB/PvdO family nonheme iron enzyme, partial [Bacteroidota bacterium]
FWLYDMAGKVAEWFEYAYAENSVPLVCDLNPIYYDENEPRKLIRGGSWKDIAFYIETGTRNFEYQDSARSFIGFRCAVTYLGRSSGLEF